MIIGPGLHLVVGGTSHKLAHPEVITWTGDAWVSLSEIAVWDGKDWQMIDLKDKTEEIITAAFAMAGATEVSPMLPPSPS